MFRVVQTLSRIRIAHTHTHAIKPETVIKRLYNMVGSRLLFGRSLSETVYSPFSRTVTVKIVIVTRLAEKHKR